MNGVDTNSMIKTYHNIHATYTSKQFLNFIDVERVSIIIEGGSRDLVDALFLEQHFKGAQIHSFECNDEAYQICAQNLERSEGRVKLNKLAMTNTNDNLIFYAFDHDSTDEHDIGVSSLYKHKNANSVPQKEITVKGIRLDHYCNINNIPRIDYLCLDVQGAEQSVLEGLGDLIKTVTYLVLENDGSCYQNAPEISDLLLADFNLVSTLCNDRLYIRK